MPTTLRLGARCLFAGAILAGASFCASMAAAQSEAYIPSASDFGGVGLMQTRTARFGPDGQLDVGYSEIMPYERYLITVQALPWLEATFRYTSVQDRDFQGNADIGVGSSFKDRGADLKFKLLSETRYFPQVALGLQDGLGTGIFSGEYLVLSKRYFDLDFTLGMGWGYSAGSGMLRNPFRSISDDFRTRGDSAGQGGNVSFGNYFRGENVGLFGGLEYTTPVKGVTLKLEYDPNDYRSEPLGSTIVATSHWNYGMNYRPFPWVDLSLAWERGESLMGRVSLRANLHATGIPKFDPPPPPLQARAPALAPDVADDGDAPYQQSPLSAAEEGASLDQAQVESALRGRGFRPAWVSWNGRDPVVMFDEVVSTPMAREVARVAAQTGPAIARVYVIGSDGRTEIVETGVPRSPDLDPLFAAIDATGVGLDGIQLDAGRPRVTLTGPVDAASAGRIAQAIFVAVPDSGTIVDVGDSATGRVQSFARSGTLPAPVRVSAAPGGSEAVGRLRLGFLSADQKAEAAEAIIASLKSENFLVDAIDLQPPRVTAYLTPRRFRQPARNIGRAAIAIANAAPPQFEEITLVLLSAGLETGRVTLRRTDLENASLFAGSPEEIWARTKIEGPAATGISPTAIYNRDRYPSFTYSFRPQVRQHIGGGDQFFLYQLWAALSANAQLTRNWSVSTTVGKDIYNNFDRITVEPQRQLPPVRSDVKKYLQQGEDNIVRLQIIGLWTLAPDLYGRVSTGIFEEMYGGVGGEILYRPFGARFAVGADLNHVRQRDYDQKFSFLDYTVTTGHLNLYYQLPVYDLLGLISVGQYLAGDKGATFQLSRRFESGVQAGVFFTLTDVPFEVFGEGSFDKGFFISVPFDLFSTRSSTVNGSFAFRPLTKDGGQRLAIGPRLYDITSGGSLDSIARDWGRILD